MQGRIWVGVLIGSAVGGLVPELWGADMISYSSVLLGSLGAVVGLIIGYNMG